MADGAKKRPFGLSNPRVKDRLAAEKANTNAILLVEFLKTCKGKKIQLQKLGSVAGPVIQATGRSEFEDGLGSGDFVSDYSYHMSVRTRCLT
jgi:hypothetical protein